ncbi:hypothetical protein GPECTOR_4g741 [Gonium pectorale]|uniref:Cytochrome P450 n=1 Tax=Gonium pectorale TaxID=33097 RepID=A0A150GXY1_GONPE|nr:hypothetical protein GPECTOR_4g741 [Gonium pectorale]|eukprot:KXZ54675.1 hypothetical protein GPECTOR_4g741 [Gonium pectorale]
MAPPLQLLIGVMLPLVLGLVLAALQYPYWRLRLAGIPGPFNWPLVGCIPQVMRHGGPRFFQRCHQQYGPVFAVSFGSTPAVVVASADLMRQYRATVVPPAVLYIGMPHRWDDFWRLVRSAWQPAFSSASLAGYLPRMTACAEQLAGRMEDRARDADGGGGGRVDMWRELGAMTLQVVGSTAYGVDFGAMGATDGAAGGDMSTAAGGGDDGGAKASVDPGPDTAAAVASSTSAQKPGYGRHLARACGDFFRYGSAFYGSRYSRIALLLPPSLRPLLVWLAHKLPDRPFTRLLRARAVLSDTCHGLIDDWKCQHGQGEQQGGQRGRQANGSAALPPAGPVTAAATAAPQEEEEGHAAAGGKAPAVEAGSFLGLILSARDKATGQGLSDSQVVAQVQTFILGGYETTANALSFAVYNIATHPEVEARLVAELDSELGSDRLPTAADLPRLVYTEAVFNEAMRLYPPAHAAPRIAFDEPTQVGRFTVPAGTPIILAIYTAHHDPRVWPRPEEFIPERFLPESPLHPQVAARVPGAHAPFGYGSRMCIGWKFAVQEAKIALACLYRRLRFELEPGQVPLPVVAALTLAPRDGLWVRPVARR